MTAILGHPTYFWFFESNTLSSHCSLLSQTCFLGSFYCFIGMSTFLVNKLADIRNELATQVLWVPTVWLVPSTSLAPRCPSHGTARRAFLPTHAAPGLPSPSAGAALSPPKIIQVFPNRSHDIPARVYLLLTGESHRLSQFYQKLRLIIESLSVNTNTGIWIITWIIKFAWQGFTKIHEGSCFTKTGLSGENPDTRNFHFSVFTHSKTTWCIKIYSPTQAECLGFGRAARELGLEPSLQWSWDSRPGKIPIRPNPPGGFQLLKTSRADGQHRYRHHAFFLSPELWALGTR